VQECKLYHPPFARVLWKQVARLEVVARHAVHFVRAGRGYVHEVPSAGIEDNGASFRALLEDHAWLVTLNPASRITALHTMHTVSIEKCTLEVS
jgi:hypothetical protein